MSDSGIDRGQPPPFWSVLPQVGFVDSEQRLIRNAYFTKAIRHIEGLPAEKVPKLLQGWVARKFKGIPLTPAIVWALRKGKAIEPEVFIGFLEQAQVISAKPVLFFPPYVSWVEQVLALQNRCIQRDIGASATLVPFTGCIQNVETGVERALGFLKELWPQGWHVVQTFIKSIIVVDSEIFWSSSVLSAHGAVVMCPREDWELAHYVETLIHESAHLELAIRQMQDPLLLNPKELGPSSLRKSERPLLGVLHAAFVMARTIYALTKLLHVSSGEEASTTQRLLSEFRCHHTLACEVLERQAQFTPDGKRLFASIKELRS